MSAPSATGTGRWAVSDAQQAVNVVAAVMAGQPRRDVAAELDGWLERRGADLPEPQYSRTVDAIAGGNAVVLLRPAARDAAADAAAASAGVR